MWFLLEGQRVICGVTGVQCTACSRDGALLLLTFLVGTLFGANSDPVVPLAAVDLLERPVRGAGHSVELVGEVELRGLTRASPENPFARRTFAASSQAEGTSGKGSSSGTAQEEAAASGEERPGGPQEDDPREKAKGAEPAGSGLRVLGLGVEPTPDSNHLSSAVSLSQGVPSELECRVYLDAAGTKTYLPSY